MVEEYDIKDKITIYRPDDVYDAMKYYLINGKVKGSTTHNVDIDQCWKWRKKETNLWSGYANEGKSLMLKQLCLIKALKDNWKFIFSAPEDLPVEEWVDDMVHTVAGQTTDKDYPNVISERLYDDVYELIRDSFIFVYVKPPDNTIKKVLDIFKEICEKETVDACIIDPVLKFAWPKDLPDNYERMAQHTGGLFVDFSRETDTSCHLVVHQVTPTFENVGGKNEDGSEKKRYTEPSMYKVKGGGSWADGFDNVLSVWRPNYAFDKIDNEVQFSSQKIKKQKLVGIPQRLKMRFDRRSNRYTDYSGNNFMFDFDTILREKGIL